MGRVVVPILAALLLFAGPAAGADKVQRDAPKSPAVREAAAKAERARKQADAAWSRAMADAKREELADLKAAQKAALEKNDVDEATAIAEFAKDVQADVDALTGKTVAAKVAAKALWQVVAKLPKGTYVVAAPGTWHNDVKRPPHTADGMPGFFKDGMPVGSLVARVNGKIVPVGSKGTLTLEDDGAVEMRMWDSDDGIGDNGGELRVTFQRQ